MHDIARTERFAQRLLFSVTFHSITFHRIITFHSITFHSITLLILFTIAPACISRTTISTRPPQQLTMRAVQPFYRERNDTSLPHTTSLITNGAKINVIKYWFRYQVYRLTVSCSSTVAPALINSSTTATWPRRQAKMRPVFSPYMYREIIRTCKTYTTVAILVHKASLFSKSLTKHSLCLKNFDVSNKSIGVIAVEN